MTRLISLTMNNYRPFYGKQTICFSANPKKPFNIVYAKTGGGKTSVLDAITWCLYGKEIHKPQPIDTMLNDKKRDELKEGETADVNIEIVMGKNEEDIDYVFSRSITFTKDTKNKVTALEYTEEPKVKIKDTRDNLINSPDPDVMARRIFPENIQHLFMFDGEALQRFFDVDNIKKTRQAILDITQMDFLENAVNHLKEVSKHYRTKDDEENPEIEQYDSLIKSLDKKINDLNIETKEYRDGLAAAKKAYAAKLEKLKRLDRKDLNSLIQDEEETGERLKKLAGELDELEKESFKHLLGSAPLIFCKKELERANKLIDEKYESGELPPSIRVDFLDKLLKKKECICGGHLKKGSAARKKVQEYRDKAPLSEYENEIRGGQTGIKMLIKQTGDFFGARKKYYKDIEEKKREVAHLNQKLQLIKKDVKGIDKDEIQSLYSEKDFQFSEIERYNSLIGQKGTEIEEKQEKRKEWEAKKRQLEKDLIKNKEMREKFGICDTSINFFEDIKEGLITGVKGAIEKKTDEVFKIGIGEPRVDKVRITDDFECQVLNSSGESIYGSLSSGQRQILATSFMIALRKESGFDSPILIDYPFGRIDPDKTADLIEALKKVLEGVQVNFFLIEGKEFTGAVLHQMKSHVGTLYEIKKLKTEKGSEVMKHEKK